MKLVASLGLLRYTERTDKKGNLWYSVENIRPMKLLYGTQFAGLNILVSEHVVSVFVRKECFKKSTNFFRNDRLYVFSTKRGSFNILSIEFGRKVKTFNIKSPDTFRGMFNATVLHNFRNKAVRYHIRKFLGQLINQQCFDGKASKCESD